MIVQWFCTRLGNSKRHSNSNKRTEAVKETNISLYLITSHLLMGQSKSSKCSVPRPLHSAIQLKSSQQIATSIWKAQRWKVISTAAQFSRVYWWIRNYENSNAQQYFIDSGFALLLRQLHAGRLRSDGDPVFVQNVRQNLPQVVVVGIEVKHIPDHAGETLRGKLLHGKKKILS